MIRDAKDQPSTSGQTTPDPVHDDKCRSTSSALHEVRSVSPESTVRSKQDFDPHGKAHVSLKGISVQTLKNDYCRLLDRYNETHNPDNEQQLLACMQQLYGKGLTHCPFSDTPLLSESQPARSIQEHDAQILQAIRQQLSLSHKQRSLAIARMTCWLAKDQLRTRVIEQYAHLLSGEDLAYIARHSRPIVADSILHEHLSRISSQSLELIAESHLPLIKRLVLDKKCLTEESDWPHLLKLCLRDSELAQIVFNQDPLQLSYIQYRHRAVLATQSLEMAEQIQAQLIMERMENPLEPCNHDERTAWRLLMTHRELAQEMMESMYDLLPADFHPIMLAEILSRHPDLSTNRKTDLDIIKGEPDAASLLLNRSLMEFMNETRQYIQENMSLEQKLELLHLYPQLAMMVLPYQGIQTLEGLSNLIDRYTTTAGDQIFNIFYQRLGPKVIDELATKLKNPAALARLRLKWRQGERVKARKDDASLQLWQESTPYLEAYKLLTAPEKRQFFEGFEEQLSAFETAYPSLASARASLSHKNPEQAIANEKLLQASYRCADLSEQIMLSPTFSDEEKIQAAGNFQKTLQMLLKEPARYLNNPETLEDMETLVPELLHPHQKHGAVAALEMGYLDSYPDFILAQLCYAHPVFVRALLKRPDLLVLMSPEVISDLCLGNPAFYHGMKSTPELTEKLKKAGLSRGDLASFEYDCEHPTFWDDTSTRNSKTENSSVDTSDKRPEVWETENFILESEAILAQKSVKKSAKPEFFPLRQGLLTEKFTDRLKGGGVCSGLCLDYASWQIKHPELHPTEYLRKLDRYVENDDQKHDKSLPERLNLLQRQHQDFISEGTSVSEEINHEAVLDIREIESLLKEHRVLYLSQEKHACTLFLWDVPKTGGAQQLAVYDPNQGIFCFIGCSQNTPWSEAARSNLTEALRNGMLQYGSKVDIKAHRIDHEKVMSSFATPVRYRSSED